MKTLIVIISLVFSFSMANGQGVFESAQNKAKENHQLILLSFSGSDWCVPCIKMRKGIFEDAGFKAMSDSFLVMVNADFPRNKKNRLGKELQLQNDAMAEKYNPNGIFPYTLLLDASGSVLKAWDGYPQKGAASFTAELRASCQEINQ